MSWIKQVLLAIGTGVLATIAAGALAFLNEVHLEISFDKLKDFDALNLKSYYKLGTALKFEVETAGDQSFVAFWVDDDNGKPIVRKSDLSYKNFHFNSRIVGTITDEDDTTYALSGYYNTDRIVFSHRGPQSGTGVYILDSFQVDDVSGPIYAGYAVFDANRKSGSNLGYVLRCPFLMLTAESAAKSFPTIEAAKKEFSFLNGACTVFDLPTNITTASTQ